MSTPSEAPAQDTEDVEMLEPEVDAFENLDNDENYEYKLVGVVLHSGTADFGHYISIANVERGTKEPNTPEWMQTDKERWLCFNDNRVSPYK
jgi:ubiquitin C-terminal hydrolase